MPIITFIPSGKTISILDNSSLHNAAKSADVSIEAPCGGHGICGKCLVKIQSGRVDFQNEGILPDDMIEDGYVLICKTKALDEPITIQTLADLDTEQGKFSNATEDIHLINKSLLPTKEDINPLVKVINIVVPQPEMGDGLSDLDRLKKAVIKELNQNEINISLNALKALPDALRQDEGKITIAYYENSNSYITAVQPKGEADINYGIAVDIGTTTVAVQLVNMVDGHILGSKTDYNAQIECGLDVISRINYARKAERLEELRQKILQTINILINELASKYSIDKKQIYNASIAANTTMVHLLLGINPEYIRLDPYTPTVYNVPLFTAAQIGIEINPDCIVYIAPSVGSYVGGDITSGVLCTSLATDKEDVCMFIDIGTNGEIVLGNNDFLLGCACSAGPAFEGGGIENGMRASVGAIELVDIDKETGVAKYSTIGNVPPIGICGSGMISLISNLFSTGWIDAAGKLNRVKNCTSIEIIGKNARYIIATAEVTDSGKPIYITEADIDNLIRAKGAIFSACYVMLQKISMEFEDLTKIYIAGGFGRYLNIEKSTIIGLIPKLPTEKFKFIGNSSIIGAYMTLLSQKHREKQQEIAQKITYIDLSTEPDYMNQYTAALFLPHTDGRLF